MSVYIPDADTVVRHCVSGRVDGRRVLPKAFYLRGDEAYVSVNWMERAHKIHRGPSAIESVYIVLRRKRSFSADDLLAELNVGEAKRVVRQAVGTGVLCVRHEPNKNDKSHAGMSWHGEDDTPYGDVAAELALLATEKTHLVGVDVGISDCR